MKPHQHSHKLQIGCSVTPLSRLLHLRTQDGGEVGGLKKTNLNHPVRMTNDLSSSLVSLAFFFHFCFLYLNQCSSECHETHHRSKPCSPGLYTQGRVWTPHTSVKNLFYPTSIDIIRWWIRDGKCQIFLTLVQ